MSAYSTGEVPVLTREEYLEALSETEWREWVAKEIHDVEAVMSKRIDRIMMSVLLASLVFVFYAGVTIWHLAVHQ